MRSNPYKIKARRSGDSIVGDVFYNKELIISQEYDSDYSSTVDGKDYSGVKAVTQDLTFISKTYGFEVGGRSYLPFVSKEEEESGPEEEDFIEKQKKLFLESGKIGISIPGLDRDEILEKLASQDPQIKKIIDTIQTGIEKRVKRGDITEEEAEEIVAEEVEKTIEAFKKNFETIVEEKIAEINQNWTVFKESIESIPSDVKAAITNLTLPPTVSVPPAAPNPVWAINLIKQTKNSLVRTLSVAVAAFALVLKNANQIKFEIPDFILDTFDKIKVAFTVINTIPV
jgi:polyhydroxyalkanoate synthesis regulator phasin